MIKYFFLCSSRISYVLFHDLAVHVRYYVTKIKQNRSGASGPEKALANEKLLDTLNTVVQQFHKENVDLCYNYHDDVEQSLLKEDRDHLEEMKKQKASQLIKTGGRLLKSQEFMPSVGIVVDKAFVDDEGSGVVRYISEAAGALSQVLVSVPTKELPIPDTFADYLREFGTEILVVLDKSETSVSAAFIKSY